MSERSLGPAYRRVWFAATASNLGDGVFLSALPLIAIGLTRDPLQLSLVTFALSVPWLLFALVSGALVDRWNRITTMRRIDLVRCALTVGLAVVIAVGALSLPVLVGFAFALGSAETLFDSASLAVVPGIVGTDPERLTRANARLEGADIVANGFIGPPVGAWLVSVVPALPAAINSVSFLVSSVVLRNVSTIDRQRVEQTRTTLRTEILVGLRWLRRQPVLSALAGVVAAINLSLAATGAVLVLLIQDEANGGIVIYGIVLSTAAAGALAGNIVAERNAERIRPQRILPPTVGALAAALLAIAAAPSTPTIIAAFAVIGLAGGLWNVITVALRQRIIPDELLGRVNSVYRLVAYGAMPVGALAGGTLAGVAGLRTPFLVGATTIAATIPYLAAALRRLGGPTSSCVTPR